MHPLDAEVYFCHYLDTMHLPASPHPRSYWVADRFLAGCYPGDRHPEQAREKIAAIVGAGVTHFVSLMEADEVGHAGESFAPYDALAREAAATGQMPEFVRHPIVDQSIPTAAEMRAILDRIDAIRAAGGTAYVHCWGGKGRTGTVVACWLIRHGHVLPANAVGHLQTLLGPNAHLFGETPETGRQRAFVAAWKEGQ